MSITAWRIVKARYAATAFRGEGARLFGGRWNSKGTVMVYTAGSQALAALEMLVHLKSSDLLKPYRLIPVTFEQRLVLILEDDALPSNWKRRQAPAVVRALGDEWTQSLKSAVLRVPSVLVPGEYNYLLNPLHGDFARIRIGKPQHFRFDRRLK